MAKNTMPQAGKKTPLTKAKMKANKTPMQPAKQAVPGAKTNTKNLKNGLGARNASMGGMY